MPFNWEKDFVEPTSKVIDKILGRKPPEGLIVEKRRTSWERILHDEDSRWERVKQFFGSKR